MAINTRNSNFKKMFVINVELQLFKCYGIWNIQNLLNIESIYECNYYIFKKYIEEAKIMSMITMKDGTQIY